MSLCPMSPSVRPVIAEMEMNAGTDQDATTVRATVVQACGMFHDTPATFGTCSDFGFPVVASSSYGVRSFVSLVCLDRVLSARCLLACLSH
uniref:Uncharacterized protein n=1 Tax=Aegilops tauschii subsp. strangulata TaxID=200361 RepID=A0A453PSR0_AEGTS